MSGQDKVNELISKREAARLGGGQKRIDAQHEKGKLTAGGLIFAKVMNLFLGKNNKINPLIGAARVSAVPDSARVVQVEGIKSDPSNHLLMHAMAPNVSGVIGSAVAAGIMMSFLS